MLRSFLLALVVLALAPTAAPAQTRTTAIEGLPGIVGPRLAGDDVVWAERQEREIVTFAEGTGGRRVLDRQPAGEVDHHAPREIALDADETRVAVFSWAVMCEDSEEGCLRYQRQSPMRFLLRTGPLAGPLAGVPACRAVAIAVGGGAVACDEHPEAVVTEADGTVRRFVSDYVQAVPNVALAGDLVAVRVRLDSGSGVRVVRRATGEELLRVDANVHRFALAADGTLAYVLSDHRTIAWSSPEAPSIHRIADIDRPAGLAVARGRIAFATLSYPDGFGGQRRDTRFTVVDLEGRTVAEHVVTGSTGLSQPTWDFDGERLAYARRPCLHAAIHVWTIDAPAPDHDGPAGCAHPVPTTAPVRAGADRRVDIPFRCAPGTRAECLGSAVFRVRWRDRRGRRRLWMPDRPARGIALEAGARTALPLRLPLRVVRRARSVRIHVRVGVSDGADVVHVIAVRLPRLA